MLVRLVLTCVFGPLTVIMGFFVYRQFGWRVYKKIGANIALGRLFRHYQAFVALLKVEYVVHVCVRAEPG